MGGGPSPVLVFLLDPQALALPSRVERWSPAAFRLLPSVFVLAESCWRILEASSVKAELEESRHMGSQGREWEGVSGGVMRGVP